MNKLILIGLFSSATSVHAENKATIVSQQTSTITGSAAGR